MNKLSNVKYINLICLALCIITMFVLKEKKYLNFDEPTQIMASHGIGLRYINSISHLSTFNSALLDKNFNLHDVFFCITDSIHYSLLYCYVKATGLNGIECYAYFALFWGVVGLVLYYVLSRQVFGDTIFVSVSMLFFITHVNCLGQIYNIRHYFFALCFVMLLAIQFLRYTAKNPTTKNIIYFLLLSDLAFLSHYFAIYIILSFAAYLIFAHRGRLFTPKNIAAVVINCIMIAVLIKLWYAQMSAVNNVVGYIDKTKAPNDSGILLTISNMAKWVGLNFSLIFSLFRDIAPVRIAVALFGILAIIWGGRRFSFRDSEEQRLYWLLVLCGIASVGLVTAFAIATKSNKVFAYRYFLFSMPFCTLFITMYLRQLLAIGNDHKVARTAGLAIFAMAYLPGFLQFGFVKIVQHNKHGHLPCNHPLTAEEIVKHNIHKVQLPEHVDAAFINSILPQGYPIDYEIKPNGNFAILYDANNNETEKIQLFKNELIVAF